MSLLPIFLIGGAGPIASREFATLIAAMPRSRPTVPLDMVVFHGGEPPVDFSMTTETDAVLKAMDEVGAERGHFLGYSGGAAVALAFACAYPERVATLTLEEPAWVGSEGATDADERFWYDLGAAMDLEHAAALRAFRDLMVKPEVRPTLGDIPSDAPWIGDMVRGVRASIEAFTGAEVDWATLNDATFAIYTVVGSLSNPMFEIRSRRIAQRVPRTQVEVFEGAHHVIPPHRSHADQWAPKLEAMWERAD